MSSTRFLNVPHFDPGLAKKEWTDLRVEARSGWQQYGVLVEAGEKVEVRLSGNVVWYHRTWTTSGSSGRTKHHVDHREAGPNKQRCRFILQEEESGSQLLALPGDIGTGPVTFDIPATLNGQGKARLAGALIESLQGGAGDNSGHYELQVRIDSTGRIERYFSALDKTLSAVQEESSILKMENGTQDVAQMYEQVTRWFPRRLPLYPHKQQQFLEQLEAIGLQIVSLVVNGRLANYKDEWLAFAACLAEWSVTREAGGKESFADGWILRGKIAGARGNFAAADEFLIRALKFAENRSPIFYEMGKLREIQGYLFSPSGREVQSEEEVLSLMTNEAELNSDIGAYDFYKLSLIFYNKRKEDGSATDGKEIGVLDYLQSYDSHYAVGRLAYLRHTTGALQEAAHHFRICRRLASLKALTTPAIQQSYAFDYLLLESFKSQANPFQTTPVASSEVNTQRPFVGIRNLDINAEIEIQDTVPELESEEEDLLIGADISWLSVNADPGVQELALLDPFLNADFGELVGRIEGSFITQLNGGLAAAGGDNAVYRALLGETGVAGYISRIIEGATGLLRGDSSPVSSRLNIAPSLIHILQNPQLLLPGLLELCLDRLSLAPLLDREVFHFESYQLRQVTPSAENPGMLRLRFYRTQHAYLEATCEFFKGRLRLLGLEIHNSMGKQLEARLSYNETDSRLIDTSSVVVRRLTKYESLDEGTLGIAEFPEGGEVDFELKFSYQPGSLLLKRLTFTFPNLRNNLSNLLKNVETDALLVGSFLDPKLVFTFEGEYGITDHASLSSAYIPFRSNYSSDAFREATSADLRWLLSQKGVNEQIVLAACEEIGRRVTASGASSSGEAFTTLFDLTSGHFDRDMVQLPAGTIVLARAKAIAGCALLAWMEGQNSAEFSEHAQRLTIEQIKALLEGLSPGNAASDVTIARALNTFQFTLLPLAEVHLLPTPQVVTDEAEVSIDEKDALYESRQLRRLQAIHANWQELTRAWVKALGRCVADDALAYHLAHNLISSGLSSSAYRTLEASGVFGEFPDSALQHWLANEALPDMQPVASVATLPNLDLRLRQMTSLMTVDQDSTGPDQKLLSVAIRGDATQGGSDIESQLIMAEKLLDDLTIYYRTRGAARYKSSLSNLMYLAQVCASIATVEENPKRLSRIAERTLTKSVRLLKGLMLKGQGSPFASVEALSTDVIDQLHELDADTNRTAGELVLHGVSQSAEPANALIAERFVQEDDPVVALELNGESTADSPDRQPSQAPMVSPLEYNAANQLTWERVLNDEPFSDGCVALMSLADRYLAQGEIAKAEEQLLEAARVLVKLRHEGLTLLSSSDKQQIPALERKVNLRLVWIDQGRDAYGRFITKAPPRRLVAIVRQFDSQLKSYSAYLRRMEDAKNQTTVEKLKTIELDMQLTDSAHDERQARLIVERNQRTIAFLQKSLSALAGRRQELDRQTQAALAQFKRGDQKSKQAAQHLGNVVMQAAMSQIPMAAQSSGISATTSKHLVTAIKASQRIAEGDDPLQVAAGAFGQELIDMAFVSFDSDGLLEGLLEDSVRAGLDQYATTGKVDLKEVAVGSMRRMGEDLLYENLSRLGSDLEDYVDQKGGEMFDDWASIKSEAELMLGDLRFDSFDEARQFVNQNLLSSDGRKKMLDKVMETVEERAKEELLEAVGDFSNSELPIKDVIDIYRHLDDADDFIIDSLKGENTEAAQRFRRELADIVGDDNIESVLQDIGAFREELKDKLVDADKVFDAFVRDGEDKLRGVLEMIAEISRQLSEFSTAIQGSRRQIAVGLAEQLRKFLREIDLGAVTRHIPFPVQRFMALNVQRYPRIALILGGDIDNVDFEEMIEKLLNHALSDDDVETAKEMIGVLQEALQTLADEVASAESRLADIRSRDLNQEAQAEINRFLDRSKDNLGELFKLDEASFAPNVQKEAGVLIRKMMNRSDKLTHRVLGTSTALEAGKRRWDDLYSSPQTLLLDRPGQVLRALDSTLAEKLPTRNGVLGSLLNTGLTPVSNEATGKYLLDVAEPLSLGDASGFFALADGAEQFKRETATRKVMEAYVDVSKPQPPEVGADFNSATQKQQAASEHQRSLETELESLRVSLADEEATLKALQEALPYAEDAETHKAQIREKIADIQALKTKLNEKRPALAELNRTANAFIPDAGSDDDIVESALGNPGVQAAIAAIGMAYPVAGVAIQGAIAINNWLSGEKDKKIGAKNLGRAQDSMRRLDKEVSETRHQRELIKIEQIVANDEVQRVLDRRDSLNHLKRAYQHESDQQIQLRRYHYHKLWANLELISYQLYILQKAFEYEFDTPLEEIFTRWPQLDQFRTLLELSPGVLAGEFSRTNVLQDLFRELGNLEELPAAIRLVKDLAIDTRYRDKTTISLRADYPDVWREFNGNAEALPPVKFSTSLQPFSGVMLQGRSIRHSFKIETVRVAAKLKAAKDHDVSVIDELLNAAETANTVYSPSRMGLHLQDERRLARTRELILAHEMPDRIKMVLFHSGIGEQVDERGSLRIIEWGPQAADSNLGVVDPDENYNLAEGLTPATDWTLVFDQQSALSGDCFEDIEIEVHFTYGRQEENSRHVYQFASQGGGLDVEASLGTRFNDRVPGSVDEDPLLAKVVTKSKARLSDRQV